MRSHFPPETLVGADPLARVPRVRLALSFEAVSRFRNARWGEAGVTQRVPGTPLRTNRPVSKRK
jgi:hypothetical protein